MGLGSVDYGIGFDAFAVASNWLVRSVGDAHWSGCWGLWKHCWLDTFPIRLEVVCKAKVFNPMK